MRKEKGMNTGILDTFIDVILSCLMIEFGCGRLLDSGCSSESSGNGQLMEYQGGFCSSSRQ